MMLSKVTKYLDLYLKTLDPIPPQDDEPLGSWRYDSTTSTVEKFQSVYIKRNCDTCGREFAIDKFSGHLNRRCSDFCDFIWDSMRKYGEKKKSILYFYREKLEDEDVGVFYRNYSPLEIDVLKVLSVNGKGMSIIDLTDEIFGYDRRDKRSSAIRACKKLYKKGMLKKTSVHQERGRPVTHYKILKRVITVDKNCPHCGNNNYNIVQSEKKVRCIYCNLKWNLEELPDGSTRDN
jgi:predicted transcriptional regulator